MSSDEPTETRRARATCLFELLTGRLLLDITVFYFAIFAFNLFELFALLKCVPHMQHGILEFKKSQWVLLFATYGFGRTQIT